MSEELERNRPQEKNNASALKPDLLAAGWRTMDSAPKDGSRFVAFPSTYWRYGTSEFAYVLCMWADAEGDPDDEENYIEAGWHDSEGHADTNLELWFPLPHIVGRAA